MIIQRRRDGTHRIFTQHDHAMLSGECAKRYVHEGKDQALAYMFNMGVGLHDLAWLEIDDWSDASNIPWDDKTQRPHDFITLPSSDKAVIYAQGIEEIVRFHPFLGLLLSQHYAAFFDKSAEFYHREAERRRALQAPLQRWLTQQKHPDDVHTVLARQYDILKFLDIISLYACLAEPGADPDDCPTWITPQWSCQGQDYRFSFSDENTLHIEPFHLSEPLTTHIPYRSFVGEFQSAKHTSERWQTAAVEQWTLSICPGQT